MKVFIGYGYNERDRWIETYVLPLVEAFGCEVLRGRTVYGGALTAEVQRLIRAADAMIGFTTCRDPRDGGGFLTHSWVILELNMAHSIPIPFVEVREQGVVVTEEFLQPPQRIDYVDSDRAACLREVALALRRLREQTAVTTVRLGPVNVVEQISFVLDVGAFSCSCQTLLGATETPPREVPLRPIKGSLFVQLRGIVPGELVRLTISAGGRVWRSTYESVDTVDIRLKE